MKKLYILFAAGLLFTGTACNKLLEVEPQNETLADEALQTPEDLQKLLNSCYDVMANAMNGRAQNFAELLSDNLEQPFNNNDYREIYTRSSNFFNTTIGNNYGDFYICIYRVNVLNQEIDNVPGVTPEQKTRILAEAAFLRAMANFELVRLWAQPYGYTSDNSHPGIALRLKASQEPIVRSSVAQVYAQIITDLNDALANVPESNGNYADKVAVKGLLAKVYFQMHDYTNAAFYAGEVIQSGKFSLSDSINRFDNVGAASEYVFTFISTSANDNRGSTFIGDYRSDNNATPQLRISQDLYTVLTQRPTDQRAKMVSVFNPGTENEFYGVLKFNKDFFSVPYIHLTEMMLTHIESLAELNQDLPTAVDELNDIMERAYGPGVVVLPSQSQASEILSNVQLERRLELFAEGDRTHNLKRMGSDGATIMVRNAPWNCPGMVLQFPVVEKTDGFELNQEGGCN